MTDGQIPTLRAEWASLSEYVKEIKQSFSRWYNKRHGRKGFFWGERFKSVLVENGDSLVNCLAYIDLNPVRAGLVERPEDYRWCSLAYHVQTGNAGDFLSLDFGLTVFGTWDAKTRLHYYRRYIYENGAQPALKSAPIDPQLVDQEAQKGFALRSCCKTYCAWNTGVARRLKILMDPAYTPVSRPLAPGSSGARDSFTTTSYTRGSPAVSHSLLHRRWCHRYQGLRIALLPAVRASL